MALAGCRAAEALLGYRGNAPASAPQRSPLSQRKHCQLSRRESLTPRAFRESNGFAETARATPKEKTMAH